MKRVTLKDLAELTGVHVSTVSRALDPVERKLLTEEVVRRVQTAADTLGYRPNRIASSLRTNRTMTVGIMIPDITNVIFPPLLRGIESVLDPLGYAAIIVNTDSEHAREDRLLNVLRDRGVDGIIHAAVLRDDPAIAKAAAEGLPVVTLNRKVERSRIPSIINDEDAGICQMLRHLRELGHHQIAHLAGPQDLSTGQSRLEAFKRAAQKQLGAFNPTLVKAAQRFDEAEGARSTDELLASGQKFTAILCANDRLALGAIDRLRERGLACPADISVTGFNDMPFLQLIRPRLTTVRIQQHEAGRIAALRLLEIINKGEPQTGPMETILPVEIVIRESTGPCRQ